MVVTRLCLKGGGRIGGNTIIGRLKKEGQKDYTNILSCITMRGKRGQNGKSKYLVERKLLSIFLPYYL